MQARRPLVLLGSLLAVSCMLSGVHALASTPFAITATNVTMPLTGLGSTQYTVTSIQMTGTLTVTCQYAGATTEAKIPTCTYGPLAEIPVNAGQTLAGTVYFYPYGSAVPLVRRGAPNRPAHQSGRVLVAGLTLTGALLLGLGFRRRGRCWLALVVFAAGALAGLGGIVACGGSSNPMTPGTYPYTITAANESDAVTPLGVAVSTTINVTVP